MKPLIRLLIVLLLAPLPALAGSSSNSKEGLAVRSAEQAMGAGQPEKARAALILALADSPDNPYLLYNIALTHYAQKDYPKAREILLQVEGMDTQTPLRALVLAQMGNIEAHIANEVYDRNPGDSIDHLRRAHQLFESALKADPSQTIASANDTPARNGLVGLILDRDGRQIEVAGQSKNLSDRIEKLMATQRDIEEVIELDPGNGTARSLRAKTRDGLISALVEMGDADIGKAAAVLEITKNERSLHEALDDARTGANAYRDALLLQPDSNPIKEKLQKANALTAQILVAIGTRNLNDAETANAKKKPEELENALQNFQEATEVDPDDATAQKMQAETSKALADLYEKTADNLVAKAEQQNRPDGEAESRTEAHENYTEAQHHAPENAELKAKTDENARALAKLLDKTGTEKLDQGIALTKSEPDKAVATLESASSDLSRAAQLMQEHGLNADATEKAKAQAEAAMNQLNQNPAEAARKSADTAKQAAQSAEQSSTQAEQAAAKAEVEKSSAAQQAAQSPQKAQKASEQSAQAAQRASEAAKSAQSAAEQAAQAQQQGQSEQAVSAAKQAEQQSQKALTAANQAAQSANQAKQPGSQTPSPQDSAQAASKAAQQAQAAAQAAQTASQQKNAQSANQAAQQAKAAAQQAQSSAQQAAQQMPQSASASAAAQSAQQAQQSANTAQAAAQQAMLNQLSQSSESALKALHEARDQAAAMSVSNGDAERSADKPPSYQSMAYVLKGKDFNKKKGGGSNSRIGTGQANFNTQAMKKPARDW